jgi:pSer/pThr/pTyr-binding forkhead associated (FHA) protein
MDSGYCHFVFLTGTRAGEAVEFASARITVGRASISDLKFDPYADLSVAAHHAEILFDGKSFILHDLGSKSGTFVNGERIAESIKLEDEDYIQFGANGPEVIFRRGPAPKELPPLPPPPVPMAELEILTGADAGKVFTIRGDRENRIGRRAGLEISLHPTAHLEVSGHHCSIIFKDGNFLVEDVSRNGTFVNDLVVKGRAYLQDGDVLTFAPAGPQALFRILPSRRHYPNRLGDRASGDIVLSPDAVAKTDERDASGLDSSSRTNGSSDHYNAFNQSSTTNSAGLHRQRRHRRKNEGRLTARSIVKWAFVSVVILGIGGGGYYAFMKLSRSPATTPITIPDYANQIKDGNSIESKDGTFIATIPKGWTHLESGNMISIESPDKVLAADYVRDTRLDKEAVLEILRNKGTIPHLVSESRYQGKKLISFFGKGGSRSWLAFLQFPENDIPMLAIIEVENDKLKQISNRVLASLGVDSIKLVPQGKAASPTPEISPKAVASPTRVAATLPQLQSTSPSLNMQVTPPNPTQVATTFQPATQLRAQDQKRLERAIHVFSPTAKLSLWLPRGWRGSETTSGVLVLSSPKATEIRITRDQVSLDPNLVFTEMQKDGWSPRLMDTVTSVGEHSDRRAYFAGMTKDDRSAILTLIDQTDSSTIVIYAAKPHVEPQELRSEVDDVVQWLVLPPPPSAPQ